MSSGLRPLGSTSDLSLMKFFDDTNLEQDYALNHVTTWARTVMVTRELSLKCSTEFHDRALLRDARPRALSGHATTLVSSAKTVIVVLQNCSFAELSIVVCCMFVVVVVCCL